MKNLLISFTAILTMGSPLLVTAENIYINYKFNQSKQNNSSNNNDNKQNIYWYDSTININKNDNKPFGDNFQLSNSQNNDSSYFDNVFLKSLKVDNNTHKLTSSIVNLQNKDLVTDLSDSRGDVNDYKIMQSLVSNKDSSKTAIQEGLAILNNCYSGKAFNFNLEGYIPSRNTFFSEYKPNTKLFAKSNDNLKQQMITPKKSSNDSLLGAKSKDIYLSFHWYGISMNMSNKILTNPIINYVNGVSDITNRILDGLEIPKVSSFYSGLSGNSIPNGYAFDLFQRLLSYSKYSSNIKNQLSSIDYKTDSGIINWLFKGTIGPQISKPFTEAQYTNLLSSLRKYCIKNLNNQFPSNKKTKDSYGDAAGNGLEIIERSFDASPQNPFDNDIDDIADVGEAVEANIDELAGDSDALLAGGTAEGTEAVDSGIVIPCIGEIIAAIVIIIIIILSVTLSHLLSSDNNSLGFDGNEFRNFLINPNYNRLNMLNPLLINFKGSMNINWLQKTNLILTPNKPKTVPPAILTPSMVSPIIAKRYNMLTGDSNDFNLQMQPSTWNQFTEGILTGDLDINKFFIKNNITNPDILLTKDDWKNIIMQMPSITINPQFVIMLHITNKKITYSNLNSETNKTNIKYGDTPYSIETLVGTSYDDSEILLNKMQLQHWTNSIDTIQNEWDDTTKDNITTKGLKNNPINNPHHYKTWQEWYYNNYVTKTFWHCGLTQKQITDFLTNLTKYYDANSLDFITSAAMTNINSNIFDITSSMFK